MKRIIPLLMMMLTIISCEQDPTNSLPNENLDHFETGQLKILLNVDNMPEDVVLVTATLSRAELDPISFNLDIGEQYATANIEDIAVGWWTLVVRALNSADNIIYSGSTYLEIIGGQSNSVNLGLSSSGDLLVNVTWEDEEDELYPDRFEENDEMSHASAIGEYQYYEGLTVTENDEDWYSIYISADSIALKCLFNHDEGDINIDILNKNGEVLESSTSTTDDEITYYIADQLDEYFIRVYLVSGEQNTYTIWWDDIWVWDNYKKSGLKNNGEGVD